jgi:hypothetical protein
MIFPFAVGTDNTGDVLCILDVYQEVEALLVLRSGLINFCCTLRSHHTNISSVMLTNFLNNNMCFVTSDKQYHYQKVLFLFTPAAYVRCDAGTCETSHKVVAVNVISYLGTDQLTYLYFCYLYLCPILFTGTWTGFSQNMLSREMMK